MDDLIRRQEAIDVFTGLLPYAIFDGYTEAFTDGLNAAYYAVCELPSAQPEIVRCNECFLHGICRFEQWLGLDGYCSKAERRTDE